MEIQFVNESLKAVLVGLGFALPVGILSCYFASVITGPIITSELHKSILLAIIVSIGFLFMSMVLYVALKEYGGLLLERLKEYDLFKKLSRNQNI